MNALARRLGWAALAVTALLAQACATLGPGDSRQSEAKPAEAMRVYIDPITGQFGEPPPGAPERATSAEAAPSTSAQVPTEIVGQTPAGGIGLVLPDRFRYYTVVTTDEEGRVTVRCQPAPPQPQP